MPSNHRPAAVAGLFYPGSAGVLRAEIARHLSTVPTPAGDLAAPKMILVPHAGYAYSGPVAAQAYALLAPLRGRISHVVLLGPAHRFAVRGLAVPGAASFDTPLGEVPVDRAAIDRLADLPQVVESDPAHAQEHSLEVQLPFLQAMLGSFSVVPLAVGRATPAEVEQVLERLWGGSETLVVISSDLSHYLTSEQAREVDSATIARILALDPVLDHDQACGATPLNAALRLDGELRGCIGRLEPGMHPLAEDVRRNARRAAFEDPRFTPVRAGEWPGLAVEVSVLGPLEPLAARSEAEAHRILRPQQDGVMFEWRGRRSTFLPQVWEQLPDAREFLAALRRKAGLPEDHWDADARIWRYAVRKFAEDEVPA